MRRGVYAALAACAALGTASALMLSLGSACSTNVQAGLEVLIATNLSGSDFDTFTLQVSQQTGSGPDGGTWTTLFTNSFAYPSTALPASFSLAASQSGSQEVLVQVAAYKGGKPIDLREAEVEVPTDHVGELTMVLSESCIGEVTLDNDEPASTCPSGQSCQPPTGTCGPTRITTPLPVYHAGDLQNVDASAGDFFLDGSVPPDASGVPHRDAETGEDAGGCRLPSTNFDAGVTCVACSVLSVSGSEKPPGYAVASDSDYVYVCVGTAACGGAYAVPYGGGLPRYLGKVPCASNLLAPSSYGLLVADEAGVTVLADKGGTATTIPTGSVTFLSAANGVVYWEEDSAVYARPIQGGAVQTVFKDVGGEVEGIDVAGDYLYASRHTSGGVGVIEQWPLDGGTPRQLALPNAPGLLKVHDDVVYYVDLTTMKSVGLDGGTPQDIFTFAGVPRAIAIDAEHVYGVGNDSSPVLLQAAKIMGDDAGVVLARSPQTISTLAVVDGGVCFGQDDGVFVVPAPP